MGFSVSDVMVKVARDGNSVVINYYVNFLFIGNYSSTETMTTRVGVVSERCEDK